MTVAGDVLVAVGAIVVMLAGLGVARFPDVYARLHSSAKATSLGIALVLLGAWFLEPSWAVLGKVLAAIAFTYLTVPVAAHVLALQAHRARLPAQLDRDDLRADDEDPRRSR